MIYYLYMKYFTTLLILIGFSLPFVTEAISPYYSPYTRNLSVGSRGDDVKYLQEYLISNNYLATNLNTGYFGQMTRLAIKRMQKENNLPQTGFFGPLTRQIVDSKLNIVDVPNKPFEGITWYMTTGTQSPRKDVWISFSNGKVQGRACNSFSGNISIDSNMKINTEGVVSTMMYCEDAFLQNAERNVHALLKNGSTISVDPSGSNLTITGDAGRVSFTKNIGGTTPREACVQLGGSWDGVSTCRSYDMSALTESVCAGFGGTYTACGSPIQQSGGGVIAPAVCVAICANIK